MAYPPVVVLGISAMTVFAAIVACYRLGPRGPESSSFIELAALRRWAVCRCAVRALKVTRTRASAIRRRPAQIDPWATFSHVSRIETRGSFAIANATEASILDYVGAAARSDLGPPRTRSDPHTALAFRLKPRLAREIPAKLSSSDAPRNRLRVPAPGKTARTCRQPAS
jgi:hypothetical protein